MLTHLVSMHRTHDLPLGHVEDADGLLIVTRCSRHHRRSAHVVRQQQQQPRRPRRQARREVSQSTLSVRAWRCSHRKGGSVNTDSQFCMEPNHSANTVRKLRSELKCLSKPPRLIQVLMKGKCCAAAATSPANYSCAIVTRHNMYRIGSDSLSPPPPPPPLLLLLLLLLLRLPACLPALFFA
eukprot:COSAG05_NODE_278_length_12330_cov_14.132205_6_plen_182_part_00